MKKRTAVILVILMVIGLAACSESGSGTGQPEANHSPSASARSDAGTESGGPTSDEIKPESRSEESTNGDTPAAQETKILVAYFSATHTTEGVAEKIADGLNADLYEIVPEAPYTDADLNYNDNNSRTTIEMNDPNARPAIAGSVENMEQYDIVFIGYPIWWGEAPRIINTFVESYSFSGKTIVPFCTSGGSGMGSSATNLHAATSGATWLSGRRFSGSDSRSAVIEWVNGLDLAITAK